MRCLTSVLLFSSLAAAQDISVYSGQADGLSKHTIYLPKTTGKIPALVWSSGGCIRDGGAQHEPALREATSHGVLIIAMGSKGGGGKGPKLARRQGSMGSDVKLMEEALQWVEKNAGSGKYANVDKTRVAVAGQSCGGLESYNVAKNPLVKVIGIFNSGMFSSSPIVKGMKKPIFYFLGGSSDIAYNNGERDYKELPTTTPTWKGNLPVGHMATYRQAKGGKFGTAMSKWIEWTLRGDNSSAVFFTGDGPGSAKADGWSVEKRSLDGIHVTPI